MLKNVAIPLMLAASEAEAQRAPDRDELQDALEGDLRKVFKGLQADAAACTVASSQAADNIANLAQAVSDAKATKETKDGDLAALVAADGAWGLADAKRKQAVADAVAQEVAANIAALLDTMDQKAEDERVKAGLYLDADKLYQAGLRRQVAAVAREGVASVRLGELQQASDNAATAASAASTQSAKEKLWRGWRYCELGAEVTNAVLATAGRWWSNLDGASASSATAPATCVVPAVLDAAGTTTLRPAITYHTDKVTVATAAAQTDVLKWTAKLVHTEALAAQNVATSFQSQSRTKAGEVAWYSESLRAAEWIKLQKAREQVYYTAINNARSDVYDIAVQMADTAGYDVAASPPAVTGLTANDAGAAKALATAATARDKNTSSSPGSGYVVPASRAQSVVSGSEWETNWTLNAASMSAWAGANGSTEGDSHKWFAKAAALSGAMDTWWTKWGTDSAQMTGAHAETGVVTTTGGGAGPCLTSSTPAGGTWTGVTGKTAIANCKTACEDATKTMLQDLDATATVAVGGATIPKWLTAQTTVWCGSYSFNNGASDADAANAKCWLLTGATGATGSAADVASSICADMTNSQAWYNAVNAVKTAYDLVTTSLYTNLTAAADAQAALEKAWLEAWYLQQYWAALKTTLHATTGGTMATQYAAKVTLLGGAGDSDTTTVAGATANVTTKKGLLDTAQEALAALESATNDAAAAVAALGTRILRADAQIASLDGLSNGSSGTLDEAAAKRLADLNAYKNDGTSGDAGESTLATAELAAANLAVKARTGAATTDGGALTEARALALAAWTLAQ